MSQRIMLAQQQLQLAQSNPQMHNLREAYRRMYMAMGVDNVDALLKPDPNTPAPMSPAMENALAMRGTQPKAFPQQNHMEHMKTHADFIATRMVQPTPLSKEQLKVPKVPKVDAKSVVKTKRIILTTYHLDDIICETL